MAISHLSPAFQRLIADEQRRRQLLAGSCYFAARFADWEGGRRFITAAINQDGSILDVGCGNGFLLRCLQEWSVHALTPYGIDTDEARLDQARELFPDHMRHFIHFDASAFVLHPRGAGVNVAGFPERFALIYWNVWDNAQLGEPPYREILDGLFGLLRPGGRLILGFYNAAKPRNLARIPELTALGYRPEGIAEAPGREEAIVWFDAPG